MNRLIRQRCISAFLMVCMILATVSMAITTNVYAGTYDRDTVSLNGTWDFYPDGGATRYDIKVPSYWDASEIFNYPSSWDSMTYGVYQKNFTVPSTMSGKQIFLNLERIQVLAKVFVNGTQVSVPATNGYLMASIPYQLDITSLANVGGSNILEVRVWGWNSFPADAKDSNGKSLFCTAIDQLKNVQGRGIGGDVSLAAYPKVYISDTFVVPDLKNNTDPSDDTVTVKVTVTNNSTINQTITVKNNAKLVGGIVEKAFTDQSVTVNANSSQIVTLTNVAWTSAKYWCPEDPKLYDLQTSLMQGSTVIDSFDTRFGFRQFSRSSNYYLLNGVKTNLRGESLLSVCHVETQHGSLAAPQQSKKDETFAQVKMELDEWKNSNMNIVRPHVAVGSKELYDYTDEIGLMVIDETPYWQYQNLGSFNSTAMNYTAEYMKLWVNARKNHPSIVIWSAGNENWGSDCTNILYPACENAIETIDVSRPIIQDAGTVADQQNNHYTGGWPANTLNSDSMYTAYSNNATKPKGEGEAFTPSQGWPVLNSDGTLANISGTTNLTKEYNNDNIISQAVWHRATLRMVRAMRYAGLADIRLFGNWIYAYEPIENTIYPTWTDYSASGIKPYKLNRTIFNAYDSSLPAFIKSDSYEYAKNTFSAVAAFDKDGDNNNRIGVNPPVYAAGSTQNRTIIVYNDEQSGGTTVNVSWEAGYLNPVNNTYISFQTGSFSKTVAYGGKAEQNISFTIPSGISLHWLQLKLTAQKGGVTKFQETNRIGAVGSLPAAKISVPSTINVGIVQNYDINQLHKIKLINIGGGLSTTWTASGQGGWLNLMKTSGNLRGEQEVYFTIDPSGLAANTLYSKTLTFTEAGGTTDSVTIQFTTSADPQPSDTSFYDGFESGFGNWETTFGTPSTSSTQKHGGNVSYILDEDKEFIQHNLTGKIASVWFYDDAADTSMACGAMADNTSTTVFLGVNTATSPTKYTYRVGSTWTATNVTRTTGWHKLEFDYSLGTGFVLKIDGTQVASSSTITSFNRILLGDAWADNKTSTVYFDDVNVTY